MQFGVSCLESSRLGFHDAGHRLSLAWVPSHHRRSLLGTPALAARLRTFLHEPDMLASLVAGNARPFEDLSWDGPAEFIGQYICHDRVPDSAACVAPVLIH